MSFVANEVSAFAISIPYYENDTIELAAGTRYQLPVTIQNNGDEGFDVNITIDDPARLVKARDHAKHIASMSFDNVFMYDLKIPDEAGSGTSYTITIIATPSINDTGQVPMNVLIKRTVTFLVIPTLAGQGKPKENQTLLFILLALALGGILYLIGKRFYRFYHVRLEHEVGQNKILPSLQRTIQHHATTHSAKRSRAITETRTIQELEETLKKIPEEQYNLPEIRQLIHTHLKQQGHEHLAIVVLTDKKKTFLRRLKP